MVVTELYYLVCEAFKVSDVVIFVLLELQSLRVGVNNNQARDLAPVCENSSSCHELVGQVNREERLVCQIHYLSFLELELQYIVYDNKHFLMLAGCMHRNEWCQKVLTVTVRNAIDR